MLVRDSNEIYLVWGKQAQAEGLNGSRDRAFRALKQAETLRDLHLAASDRAKYWEHRFEEIVYLSTLGIFFSVTGHTVWALAFRAHNGLVHLADLGASLIFISGTLAIGIHVFVFLLNLTEMRLYMTKLRHFEAEWGDEQNVREH